MPPSPGAAAIADAAAQRRAQAVPLVLQALDNGTPAATIVHNLELMGFDAEQRVAILTAVRDMRAPQPEPPPYETPEEEAQRIEDAEERDLVLEQEVDEHEAVDNDGQPLVPQDQRPAYLNHELPNGRGLSYKPAGVASREAARRLEKMLAEKDIDADAVDRECLLIYLDCARSHRPGTRVAAANNIRKIARDLSRKSKHEMGDLRRAVERGKTPPAQG